MRLRVLALVAMLTAACAATTLAAPDPDKVLHSSFNAPETGYDPAKTSDVYSHGVMENIFEPLLTYDYVARPAKLIPLIATSMPQVSADGLTYTIHIQKGIYFADDPVFKGKKRELTAADEVYALKRIADPATGSPSNYLVAGHFVGVDELVAKAKNGKFDYDAPCEGIKALDRYTIQLKLKQLYPALPYVLAMPHTSPVAREVMEAYGQNSLAHPVGTGPYILKEWKPGVKTTLVYNPNFRHVVFDFHPTPGDKAGEQVAREMNGKTMPQIGRIEVSIFTEEQPMWLAFKSGQLDELYSIPQPLLRGVLNMDPKNPRRAALKSEYRKAGLKISRVLDPEITYWAFNMQDPVLGGLSKEKIALRRAIAMSFDTDQTIRDIRRNNAVRVEYTIPPGVVGHNPNFKYHYEFNRPLANALLDEFGYKIGPDGYRMTPEGKPISIDFLTDASAIGRQWNEYWQEALDSIHIRTVFRPVMFNDALKALRSCTYGIYGAAWIADYPDGENFAMLNYSKNIGAENTACYNSPRYDKLYLASQKLQDSPERNHLYDEMNKVMMEETPWLPGETRFRNRMMQPRVLGDEVHPIFQVSWRFMDIQK
ncbi:ABC transporter substrate-binding protein [Silvimonas iriomotensis]|uniref:Heme-binding protein n=1 Tax=Silvimonas iriomotensis TaxID=449662 RepID=A0ABQ2P831_9NEIS|nr:ABC transporter substrate-binding protein [Silvimonas iriomotensis]GGP20498.1 heme-binding protein [Silvimonas iriomotensis]